MKITRRNALTAGLATAGSSLLAQALPVHTLNPARPVTTVPATIQTFFQNSYLEAKAGGMTREHLNQTIGICQTLFGQWDEDGTLDKMQAKLTPAYIAGATFDRQALADMLNTNGFKVDANDLINLEANFEAIKPQIPTDVRVGLAAVVITLGHLSDTARTVTYNGQRQPFLGQDKFRRVAVGGVCWPAVYGAFVGLFALGAFEFPPVAIAFGILSFFFQIEAIMVC